MKISSLIGSLLVLASTGSAYAGAPVNGPIIRVSEPGMLELMAIGAVVAIIVAIRKRRK